MWQVLPLGPTGYGDSPYQCFSAFAGNPLLVGLDTLAEEGLLSASRPGRIRRTSPRTPWTTAPCIAYKLPLLDRAYRRLREGRERRASATAFEAFRREQSAWLRRTTRSSPWSRKRTAACRGRTGKRTSARGEPRGARRLAARARRRRCAAREFGQYLFFAQWRTLQARRHERGIHVMGDIPIFVAHDSADVWAHPDLFLLTRGRHARVRGRRAPGLLQRHRPALGQPAVPLGPHGGAAGTRGGSRASAPPSPWWTSCASTTSAGSRPTGRCPATPRRPSTGEWVKGPGSGALRRACSKALGELPIVAENLGVITPEVEALRERFGFPGMAILQFAFGSRSAGLDVHPAQLRARAGGLHRHPRQRHHRRAGGRRGRGHARAARRTWSGARLRASTTWTPTGREIHWDFIRAVLASVAELAVVPAAGRARPRAARRA